MIRPRDRAMLFLLAVQLPPQSLEALGPFIEERTVHTEFGQVGPLARRGRPAGPQVWVQPYSGLPSRTDPRATLRAAQILNVRQILAWDTAIALNPVLGLGQPLLVTDYIDFTRHQPQTFFASNPHTIAALGPGTEGNGDIKPAVCPYLTDLLSRTLSMPRSIAGVYLGVDGPRRETAAEARMFRGWGADVLGQNLVPEIALARELGLCFAGLVTVTALSAERPPVPQEEGLRGLEAVMEALPAFLQSRESNTPCDCGRR